MANWARVHFRHLRNLIQANRPLGRFAGDDISTLPLIEVESVRWSLTLAFYQAPDPGEEFGGTLLVYDRLLLGSTESITDCYAPLCALRRIAAWCEGVYAQA